MHLAVGGFSVPWFWRCGFSVCFRAGCLVVLYGCVYVWYVVILRFCLGFGFVWVWRDVGLAVGGWQGAGSCAVVAGGGVCLLAELAVIVPGAFGFLAWLLANWVRWFCIVGWVWRFDVGWYNTVLVWYFGFRC